MARIWDPVAEDWKYGDDPGALEAAIYGQNEVPTNWFNADGSPNLALVYSGSNPGNAVYDRETNELISGNPWKASDVYGFRPETYGTGAADASWLTFAQKNGYPLDWRQSTPQQQAEYNDFLRATFPYEGTSGFGSGLVDFVQSMPPPLKAVLLAGAGDALGLGNLLGTSNATSGMSAADIQGLTQMAADAGLTGPAAQAFINAGGMANLAPLAGMEGAPSWLMDMGGGSSGIDIPTGEGGPANYSLPQNTPVPTNSGIESTFNPEGWDDVLPPGGATGLPQPSFLQQLKDAGVPWEKIQAISSIPSGTSLIQRLMSGNASATDYLELAGKLGSTALGVLGATNQQDALSSNADKYLALGQPYRDRLNATYQPGFTMASDPGYTDALNSTSDALLRQLSATGGNPYGNPGGLIEANKKINASLALPALHNYRSQLGTFGQLGVNTAGASDTAAAGSSGGIYDALGYGLSQFTSPPNPLNDLLKQIQKQSYDVNVGKFLS